jgi:hypothetical protein
MPYHITSTYLLVQPLDLLQLGSQARVLLPELLDLPLALQRPRAVAEPEVVVGLGPLSRLMEKTISHAFTFLQPNTLQ